MPELVKKSRELARPAGVQERVEFREQDLFATDLGRASVVTMYLLPAVNLQLLAAPPDAAPGTRVVSHDWDMGDWLPDRTSRSTCPTRRSARRSCRASTSDRARVGAGHWCAAGNRLEIAQRFQTFSARDGDREPGAAGLRRPDRGLDAALARPHAVRAEDRGRRAAHATRRHRDRAGLAGGGAIPACDLEELLMKVFRRGMSGAAVSGLQQALLDKVFDPGLIDGAFGGGTEAAVHRLPEERGPAGRWHRRSADVEAHCARAPARLCPT